MLSLLGKIVAYSIRYRINDENVTTLLQKVVRRFPHKLALVGDDSQLTFSQLEDFSNKIANIFHAALIRENDSVALFGGSSPEYVAIWIGLSKLKVRTALVNSNLLAEPLTHSINAANARTIIVDTDLLPPFETIRKKCLDKQIYYYNSNPSVEKPRDVPGDRWLNSLVAQASSEVKGKTPKAKLTDVLMYVYTSGTTGLPKASLITHSRFVTVSNSIRTISGIRTNDTIYCPLPLYHATGGIIAMGMTLAHGSTLVVKKKFSAKHFWEDVVKHRCSAIIYIGEVCRFLLAQEPSSLDQQHDVRVAFGHGLRPAQWTEFMQRFNIKDIRETYGSTEGNCGMGNPHGKVGAVGYLSPALGRIIKGPVIIPIDKESGQLIRSENGFYRQSYPGEEGEVIGPIASSVFRKFDGYTDKKATSSKIIENVLKKGDKYFRTGDLVVRNQEGFVFFVDRMGDSYRWKGENVSTTEVEGIISQLWNYVDVAVFGVEIPGNEGRAGMLCIANKDKTFDVARAYGQFSSHLPSYAIPVFIRISNAVDMTGTFKISKTNLKKEGFDPDKVRGDKTYVLDCEKKAYRPVTIDLYQQIMKGQTRF